MPVKISGTILAGGNASRYEGKLKPKIIIDGETIVSRITSVLRGFFDEIIIVTSQPEEFKDFNFCRIVQDEIPNTGPLGGIHAAMKASSYEAIFVFAGDMPFLSKEIIEKLIEVYGNADCDAVIPVIEEYIEPLHSIYSISLAGHLESYLGSFHGCAVKDYIKLLNVKYHYLERTAENIKAFTNINVPSDLNPTVGTGGSILQ